MLINKIFKRIFGLILSYWSHEKYAKHIGVKMGDDVHIYGNPMECLAQSLGVLL